MKTKATIESTNTLSNSTKTTANYFKKTTTALIVAGVISAISLPVAAKKYRDYANSAIDYAHVIDAVPVVETYQVNRPLEQCWNEEVTRRDTRHNRRHNSRTPEVLGAIIGGVIGNRFGHGDGRKIATVAGAVLGTSVGRDIKHNNRRNTRHGSGRYEQSRYETVQRCELQDNYISEERVIGYDVSYKYRGNVFHTQMPQEPGKKIKVKVTVNPV